MPPPRSACEARSSPRIARASSKRPSMAGAQRAERRVHRERRDLDPRPCAERDDRPQADAGGRVVTLSAAFVVSVSDNLGQQLVKQGSSAEPNATQSPFGLMVWPYEVMREHARRPVSTLNPGLSPRAANLPTTAKPDLRYSRLWVRSIPSAHVATLSTRSSTKRSTRVTWSRPAPTPTRSSRDARGVSNASRAAQTPDATWLKSTKVEARRCARQSRDGPKATPEPSQVLNILGHD